jgi:NAD+ diphosphatase
MRESRPSFVAAAVAPETVEGPAWWFVFRGRELLVHPQQMLRPVESLEELGLPAVRTQYLGLYGEAHCFSAEVARDFEAPAELVFRDLRMLYGRLDPELHALASRAVQVVEWDRTHQYCGACGERTEVSDSERCRQCPRCGLSNYPRLAPSMIVAVERDGEILLGRSPHFPPGIYSVLAGFVEPGESVEETVLREVWEETGIEVEDIRYFGSQPWPYPHSLMLGFQARYARGAIRVDGVEVEDAGWFRVDAMPPTFPGSVSISQWLIQDFLARHRSR